MPNVNELKEKLVQSGQFELSEIEDKKKKELEELIQTLRSAEEIFSSSTPKVETTPEITSKPEQEVHTFNGKDVKPSDKEWTDYILSLLDDKKEMENGNPRTDGLRRVTYLIFGDFNNITTVVASPCLENNYRASVVSSISFHKSGKNVDGCADVYSGNTDVKFAKHALATAETRAEGRAFRKALFLTKVLSAEEANDAGQDEPTGQDGRINKSMLSGLYMMCNRVGIDFDKLLIQKDIKVNDHAELTDKQGKELASIISRAQREGFDQSLKKNA